MVVYRKYILKYSPEEDNAEVIEILNRANQYRQQGDFDRGLSLLDGVSATHPEEPEAYWTAVLCRYGVTYEQDSSLRSWNAVCHRMLTDSILEDEDYLLAKKYVSLPMQNYYT